MPFTRSRQAALRGGRRSEAVPDEADSTVAHWAMPPRKRRRSDGLTGTCGVDWQSGLPEGPLLRVFELLHAEQANAAMHSAAAACSQWREAFIEVVLGDTAASRPERPLLLCAGPAPRKAAAAGATVVTPCAAECDLSKSETQGCEASSGRGPDLGARAAPAAHQYTGRRQQHAGALSPVSNAATATATQRGQQPVPVLPQHAASSPPQVQQHRHNTRSSGPATFGTHPALEHPGAGHNAVLLPPGVATPVAVPRRRACRKQTRSPPVMVMNQGGEDTAAAAPVEAAAGSGDTTGMLTQPSGGLHLTAHRGPSAGKGRRFSPAHRLHSPEAANALEASPEVGLQQQQQQAATMATATASPQQHIMHAVAQGQATRPTRRRGRSQQQRHSQEADTCMQTVRAVAPQQLLAQQQQQRSDSTEAVAQGAPVINNSGAAVAAAVGGAQEGSSARVVDSSWLGHLLRLPSWLRVRSVTTSS